MSAEQTGRPTEQEWALDLAEEVWTDDEPTAAEVDLMRRVLASDWLAAHIDQEREDARAEGMAAVAGVVRAMADRMAELGAAYRGTGRGNSYDVAAKSIHTGLPADATEALASLKAQWQAEALREAAHYYGVIWGTGLTTEEQVAAVLNHWAESGVGTPLARTPGGDS
ncbi:hypothetical protein [Nocardioides campestrisoli]|uniref:hypothetical protein n=1 Tax=Nocardioides campestrisoli TaxID=2736757 RepID=UPI0015E7896F|nr:hypothetical protein [Nocardioides campestrisoli]